MTTTKEAPVWIREKMIAKVRAVAQNKSNTTLGLSQILQRTESAILASAKHLQASSQALEKQALKFKLELDVRLSKN